jgi:hypothetical protein
MKMALFLASHGGPIGADSYVRICYDPKSNTILRLEIRDFIPAPQLLNDAPAALAVVPKPLPCLIPANPLRASRANIDQSNRPLARGTRGPLYILGRALRLPSPLPEIAILRLHDVHLRELWNWRKSRRPRNSESQLCVSSRNVRRGQRIRGTCGEQLSRC